MRAQKAAGATEIAIALINPVETRPTVRSARAIREPSAIGDLAVSSHGRPVKAEAALIFPFVSDRGSASFLHPRGKLAMRIAIYRWCLNHHVGRIRGGRRLLRVLHWLTPALSSYPIRLDDGLAPIYIDLTRATWQEVKLFTAPSVHEAPLQALFRALINPTDRVVNIGANLGRHMVLLDHLAAHVDAVEPELSIPAEPPAHGSRTAAHNPSRGVRSVITQGPSA